MIELFTIVKELCSHKNHHAIESVMHSHCTVSRKNDATLFLTITLAFLGRFLAQLAEFFKLVKMLSLSVDVCLDVNQSGTNRNS